MYVCMNLNLYVLDSGFTYRCAYMSSSKIRVPVQLYIVYFSWNLWMDHITRNLKVKKAHRVLMWGLANSGLYEGEEVIRYSTAVDLARVRVSQNLCILCRLVDIVERYISTLYDCILYVLFVHGVFFCTSKYILSFKVSIRQPHTIKPRKPKQRT